MSEQKDPKFDNKIADALILEELEDQNQLSPSKIPKKDIFPQTSFQGEENCQNDKEIISTFEQNSLKILPKNSEMISNSPASLKSEIQEIKHITLEEEDEDQDQESDPYF